MWFLTIISFLLVVARAEERHVPGEYPTIQQAIAACERSDTVIIATGRYHEAIVVPDFCVTIAGSYIFTGDTNDIPATTIVTSFGQSSITALDNSFADSLHILGLRFVGEVFSGNTQTGGIASYNRALFVSHCIFDTCCGAGGGILKIQDGMARVENSRLITCNGGAGSLISISHAVCSILGSSISRCEANERIFRLEDCDIVADSVVVSHTGNATLPKLFDIRGDANIAIRNSTFRANRMFAGFHATENTSLVNLNCDSSIFDSIACGLSFLELDGFWDNGSTLNFKHSIFSAMSVIEGFGGSFLLAVGSHNQISGQIVENVFYQNNRRQTSAITKSQESDFLIERNFFIENSSEGFLSRPGGATLLMGNQPETFKENVFIRNENFAVDHFGNSDPGHAEHNYWGDASGPFNAWSNPEGLGDTVDTLIFYEPWEVDTLFLAAQDDPDVPITFALGYPFPNPFNSSVTIEYALTREQEIKLEIFDVLGRVVESLLSERQGIGVHSVLWNADEFASGLYFARLSSDEGAAQAVKLMLLK